MNRNEYTKQLAESLFNEASEHASDEPDGSLLNAPLNNFFGDDFFTLLFRSDDPVAKPLREIKQQLVEVSSRDRPRHTRASAAVALGRFIQSRFPENRYCRGVSQAEKWFYLARQLNSVVGAHALAMVLVEQQSLRIEFDLDTDPLPRVEGTNRHSLGSESQLNSESSHAFYLGARVALRHMQRRFSNWDSEAFNCAFACIVNYLALLPGGRMGSYSSPFQQRRHALAWIKPLWNRLIDGVCALTPDGDEARRAELIEQQLAVLVYLDDVEQKNGNGSGLSRMRSLQQEKAKSNKKAGPNELIVVPGTIPKTSDKADNLYLEQFEVLQEPMKFKPLPDLETLQAVKETLLNEFPWAHDAVTLIMGDFIARRRHGVQRLGMTPVLLVGPPGTGKTRFVQRLGELLHTPNTVINLAGITDVKLLKGVTRGWASNRTSRIVEFIQQTQVPNPLFILDEIDKAHSTYSNGGDPQEALLDLLEPGNARRYQDIYLMTECDLSHCLYVATSNSLSALSEPLLSRLRPVLFPAPGPEYSPVILKGVVRDLERSWNLPSGAVTVTPRQAALLHGLSPREMRRALLELLGQEQDEAAYAHH